MIRITKTDGSKATLRRDCGCLPEAHGDVPCWYHKLYVTDKARSRRALDEGYLWRHVDIEQTRLRELEWVFRHHNIESIDEVLP